MSVATKTPAQTTYRPRRMRVTEVDAAIRAQALEAACVGSGMVALHFATAKGIVVVHCPADPFCRLARGARDHHGRPWPAFTGSKRDALQAVLEADAAGSAHKGIVHFSESGVKPDPQKSLRGGIPRFHPALADLPEVAIRTGCRKLTDESIKSLRTAWERFITDQSISVSHVVRQLGAARGTVESYFRKFRSAQSTHTDQTDTVMQRSPVLKPGGRLL